MTVTNLLRLPGLAALILLLAGSAAAKDAHSDAARAFHRALGHTNREADYRALERWAFEAGLPDAERRTRVEEAVWVLADESDDRQPFHSEKQVPCAHVCSSAFKRRGRYGEWRS